MTDRDTFHNGIVNLLQVQKTLERPPKRKEIPKLVDKIVKEEHLRHDIRERYFVLLATCALMGLEPMYNAYKPRRKHAHKEK